MSGMPNLTTSRLRAVGRPTASNEKSDALRAIVRAIIATDFEGVQTHAAEALGMARGSLNDFLNRRVNAGEQLQTGLSRYLQRPVEEIVAANGDLVALRSERASARSVEVVFGQLHRWPELLASARAIDPSVPDWCWRHVADAVVWIRRPVTPAMIVDMARFVRTHVPPPAVG